MLSSQTKVMRASLLLTVCLVIHSLSRSWSNFFLSPMQLDTVTVRPVVVVKVVNVKPALTLNSNTKNGVDTNTNTNVPTSMLDNATITDMNIVLRQGDLPGYTGWARPSNTLAGSFSLIPSYDTIGTIQQNWTCTVHCHHAACAAGGALFFVRAYGPAILPGFVRDHGNGTYDVTFLPFDPGLYTVEVVLAFANHPAWSDFPVKQEQEPIYEGYLLPGFPLPVHVVPEQHTPPLTTDMLSSSSQTKPQELPPCNTSMLTETSTHSALTSGRWVVRQTNMQAPYVVYDGNQSSRTSALKATGTLTRYQKGETSLGIDVEYVPTSCSLLSERALREPGTLASCRAAHTGSANKSLHVIFIGDSSSRTQADMFDRFFGRGKLTSKSRHHSAMHDRLYGPGQLKTTWLSTEGGLTVETVQNIQKELRKLATAVVTKAKSKSSTETDYFILFHAGLDDLERTRVSVQQYRDSLTVLVTAVAAFPARLRVWQTTPVPGGHSHKWGNYGVAWPADQWQHLTLPRADPAAIDHWNRVAWEVLQPFLDSNKRNGEIAVVDAYWLTLSRPDHRGGPHIYSVLMRKWATLILETICPS
jgi:hypothetical protein